MIKWIKSLIEKFFGKFCECKNDPLVLHEDIKESKIKAVCEKHPDGYKKTCPSCREIK